MVLAADKACQLNEFRVDTPRAVTYSSGDFGDGLSIERGRPTSMNGKFLTALLVLALVALVAAPTVLAQAPSAPAPHGGGEASLKIPDLGQVHVGGIGGRTLLTLGLGVCVLGLVFGLVIFNQLKNLPVHESMREISELIYETCKTYLITQGKFILLLDLFIGFAIGESLGAAALRIAGGIFTKIADIGSDLMKIVFNIKEDDARNPGVIADCTGDNAGDSVGPSADGFETYGVTGVALISFILLAVKDEHVQIQLLVWIFAIRIIMVLVSIASYWLNEAIAQARYGNADKMNFEAPLTSLVWLTS